MLENLSTKRGFPTFSL